MNFEKQFLNQESSDAPEENKDTSSAERKDFGPHEFILADVDLEKSRPILRKHNVRYQERLLTPKKIVDQHGGFVPAEYVLAVFDPQNPRVPANKEYADRIFNLLREEQILLRKANLSHDQ